MKYLYVFLIVLLLPFSAVQAATLYSSVRDGVDLYEKEQYADALKLFLDAQVENPENAVLKFDIAACHYKLQKYEEAATGYLDVVSTAQDAAMETQALYNLGNTMYRQGKLEDAVEYYKKSLELDSDDEDARKNLDFVREEIKRRKNEAKDTQKRRKEGQKDEQQNQQQDKQEGQQDQQKDQQEEGRQQGQSESQKDDSQDSQKQNQQQDSRESKPDNRQEPQQQQGQGSSAGEQDEEMQQSAGQSGQQDGSQQAQDDMRDIAGADRPMSAQEAEQWLRGLEENREKLQQFRRRSQPGRSRRPEKDW